jgi:hypothetical protein
MPNQESILTFQKGLQVLASAEDYISLKNTIIHLLSVTELQDEIIAKDAIANVLRKKQAVDIQRFKHYPRELEAIDQRYKDLATVLENTGACLPDSEIKALGGSANSGSIVRNSPLDIISKLSKTAIVDFFLKNKVFSVGSAAALAGGSYLVYKKFFDTGLKIENPAPLDKESNFEKTIRSIQKYRAFSQLSKDPDFDGNYLEVFQGKAPKKKKPTTAKKKSPEDIGTQWDKEERGLMNSMDISFNEISVRPRMEFQMPELPAPNNINLNEIIGTAVPIEIEEPIFKKEKRSRPKKDENREEKTKKEAPSQSMGRLVPIVKRTKRIKKVEA